MQCVCEHAGLRLVLVRARIGLSWTHVGRNNLSGYKCVSGAENSAYLTGSCKGDASTAFNTEPLMCPATGFPSWAIALIVIGSIVVVGIVVFAITKMRKSSEYEEIN